ncbi:glycine zipper 2TM domain-containing protein [Fontimonas sp. SYSU GA230001]|uniref:glycine zipper 2TM domain-containing protein n=1 Tax=Fontimonas sp. SYSU GA230001 TaxID=3142450 RepID=UPI0032B47749
MKQPSLVAIFALAFVTPAAFADHGRYGRDDLEFARVVSATPVYRTVRIEEPSRECWDERVVYPGGYRREDLAAGTVVGAIAGGVAGHQFGKGRGRDAATVLGVLVGASLGQQAMAAQRPPRAERVTYEQRCRPVQAVRYEQRLDGYDVAYRYNGRIYHTRMPYDPGHRIAVQVDVRPAGY